jgi:hypothetical protein
VYLRYPVVAIECVVGDRREAAACGRGPRPVCLSRSLAHSRTHFLSFAYWMTAGHCEETSGAKVEAIYVVC